MQYSVFMENMKMKRKRDKKFESQIFEQVPAHNLDCTYIFSNIQNFLIDFRSVKKQVKSYRF